jgi:Protein of unknown function (DUF3467)
MWYTPFPNGRKKKVYLPTKPNHTMEENPQNHLNIELPEEVAEGNYSNLVVISHSGAEFVFDFIRVMPGLPKAKVKSRIVMAPPHAKRLLFALKENIEKFERAFGPIDLKDNPGMPFPPAFGGPKGIA